jgi:hypothetical protein
MTFEQYGAGWPEDPFERAAREGWYDRLAEEVGTEDNPTESLAPLDEGLRHLAFGEASLELTVTQPGGAWTGGNGL